MPAAFVAVAIVCEESKVVDWQDPSSCWDQALVSVLVVFLALVIVVVMVLACWCWTLLVDAISWGLPYAPSSKPSL